MSDSGNDSALHREPDEHRGYTEGALDAEGRRTGLWRHYATDGRLRSEFHYLDGALHGDAVWYRANGELLQRGGFDRDEKHGVWRRWTAAGDPLDEGAFDHGRKVGPWVVFHPDGTVKKTTNHKGPPPASRD